MNRVPTCHHNIQTHKPRCVLENLPERLGAGKQSLTCLLGNLFIRVHKRTTYTILKTDYWHNCINGPFNQLRMWSVCAVAQTDHAEDGFAKFCERFNVLSDHKFHRLNLGITVEPAGCPVCNVQFSSHCNAYTVLLPAH